MKAEAETSSAGNLGAVRTLRWEFVARTLFYAASVAKFLIRRKTVRVFTLAAACFVMYLCRHAEPFLRLAAGFAFLGLRMVSMTQNTDPTARFNAYFARKKARLDAITEARLRKEPWRRPRAGLAIPEEHVGHYLGDFQQRSRHPQPLPCAAQPGARVYIDVAHRILR